MRAFFIGKDPQSQDDDESPTLFATDRTDETTFVVQGWRVTDPEITSKIAGGGVLKKRYSDRSSRGSAGYAPAIFSRGYATSEGFLSGYLRLKPPASCR